MSASNHSKKSEQSNRSRILKRTLIASAIGIVMLFLLLLFFSAVLLKTDTAGGALKISALAAAGIASLIAGFAAVRPVRKNGLILGAASGIPLALALLAACAAFAGTPGTGALVAIAVILACGAVGGVAAANKRNTRSRKL